MNDQETNLGGGQPAPDPQPETESGATIAADLQQKQPEPSAADLDVTAEEQQAKEATTAAAAQNVSERLKTHLDSDSDSQAPAESIGKIAGSQAGAQAGPAVLADPNVPDPSARDHSDDLVNVLVRKFPTPSLFAKFVLELEDRVNQVEAKLAHHGITGPAIEAEAEKVLNEVGEAAGEAFEQR